MGGHHYFAWWLSYLAVERFWSALARLSLFFVTQTGVETAPLLCRASISGTVGSFQSGEAFTGQRALSIEGVGVAKVMKRIHGRAPGSSFQYHLPAEVEILTTQGQKDLYETRCIMG